MKAAILGTTDYHTTMQQIAQNALQRMGGYIPQKAEIPTSLPPISEDFSGCAVETIQKILDWKLGTDINPRSLYLFLVWVLVGSDNPYHLCKHDEKIPFDKRVATLLIRLALGDELRRDEVRTIEVSGYTTFLRIEKVKVISLDESFTTTLAEHIIKVINAAYDRLASKHWNGDLFTIWSCFTQQMQEWAYISDEEAGLIARQLLFDILDAGT